MVTILILYIVLGVLVATGGYLRTQSLTQRHQSYVSVTNETGNIVIQAFENEGLEALDRCAWNQEIGKFLFLLHLIDKTYGLRSASRSQHWQVMATCPWLIVLEKPVHYRRVVKSRLAVEYVTSVLYSGQASPYHQTRVQRMLVAMSKSAIHMVEKSEYAEERMTIAIIKCVQEKKGFCSRIYLFSFDIKTIAKLGLWAREEADGHRRIVIDIREEHFLFKGYPAASD